METELAYRYRIKELEDEVTELRGLVADYQHRETQLLAEIEKLTGELLAATPQPPIVPAANKDEFLNPKPKQWGTGRVAPQEQGLEADWQPVMAAFLRLPQPVEALRTTHTIHRVIPDLLLYYDPDYNAYLNGYTTNTNFRLTVPITQADLDRYEITEVRPLTPEEYALYCSQYQNVML